MKRRSSLLVVSCSGVWLGDFPERRHRRFAIILDNLGAGGECFLAVSLLQFPGPAQRQHLVPTWEVEH